MTIPQWLEMLKALLEDEHGINERAWYLINRNAPLRVMNFLMPLVQSTEGRYYVQNGRIDNALKADKGSRYPIL